MIQSRRLGDARITRVLEYSGPTHAPEFLFPDDLDRARLAANASWLAPHYYVPAMDRLVITIQLWLLQIGDRTIVVDTGVGNRKPRPAERMNMLNTLVEPWLEAAGARPDSVTDVVMTHLHTDHVGWNTIADADGRWVPTFPNATYHLPQTDFAWFRAEFDKDPAFQGGSFADSVVPILDAGLARFTGDGATVAGCLTSEPVPGHSPGMLAYRLHAGGETAVFSADVFHHPIQIAEPDWCSRYDWNRDLSRASRRRFLAQSAEDGALVMPMHFGVPYCGYIRRQGAGFAFEAAEWAE